MRQDKALVMVLAEAEREAVEAVNCIMQKNGLPCFLMEPIVGKIHRKLLDGKADELAEAVYRAKAPSNVDKNEDRGENIPKETEKEL